MKRHRHTFISIFFLVVSVYSFGQTNIFQDSGNVGIGTTVPNSRLSIGSDGESSYSLFVESGLSGPYRVPLKVYRRSESTNHHLQIWSSDIGGIGSEVAKLMGDGSLLLGIGGGNVGIGTTNPMAKLGIKVSGDGEELLRFSTDRPWVFRQVRSGESTGLDLRSVVGGKSFTITSFDDRVIANFYTSTSTNPGRITLVPGGGNVGIGTTSPSHPLEVNGTVRAKEVKLEANNWPDYVFSEGYRLPSLEETQSFIEAHGHLPGLKPAEEYEAEGVNMLELNQKLLEKIEELTLYVIDQRSVMNDQGRKIDDLELELRELKEIIKGQL